MRRSQLKYPPHNHTVSHNHAPFLPLLSEYFAVSSQQHGGVAQCSRSSASLASLRDFGSICTFWCRGSPTSILRVPVPLFATPKAFAKYKYRGPVALLFAVVTLHHDGDLDGPIARHSHAILVMRMDRKHVTQAARLSCQEKNMYDFAPGSSWVSIEADVR